MLRTPGTVPARFPHGQLIAASTTPDGEPLTLSCEGGEHVVRVRGELLMSSRQSGSEQAMARLAFGARAAPRRACALVAGLGMGFTLRALLDALGAEARIEVVELLEDVVRWNRGPLRRHAAHPLADRRVHLTVGSLQAYLARSHPAFDAILLDLDNGPEAFTIADNAHLYSRRGLATLHDALTAGGTLVVWSAFRSRRFELALQRAGFSARSETVRARAAAARKQPNAETSGPGPKGARHTLFVATRPPADRGAQDVQRTPAHGTRRSASSRRARIRRVRP